MRQKTMQTILSKLDASGELKNGFVQHNLINYKLRVIMYHQVDVEIGKRIRHRRWALGLTQLDLANSIGVRFQQVQKYEMGKNRVSASRLWLISKALSVGIEFFFDDIESTTQPDAKTNFEESYIA